MTALLPLLFVAIGIVAIGATLSSLVAAMAPIRALRDALTEESETKPAFPAPAALGRREHRPERTIRANSGERPRFGYERALCPVA